MKAITIILACSLPLRLAAQTPGTSYTPIVGYDDKNGALFGAAAFGYLDGRPGYNRGIYGVTNGGSFNSLNIDWDKRGEGGLDIYIASHAAQAFDNYYGEGSLTLAEDGKISRMDLQEANVDASALQAMGAHLALGPSLALKGRRPTGFDVKGAAFDPSASNNEAYAGLGLKAVYDDRDSSLSATQGHRASLDLRALPRVLAMGPLAEDAWQAQGEFRQYGKMYGVVLAQRLEGGLSYGGPSYSQRYRLGGTGRLRGFQDNRFRGRNFYSVQHELRVPVWKMVSAAASVDVGEAGDGALLRPRKSGQLGLRVGLPPDYGMKARLDFGYGDGGERSMALQFGETF
jgi:hypothetical protein